MASKGRSWLLPLIVLFLVVTGITWPFLDDESIDRPVKAKDVVVRGWNWNKSVAGDFYAVHGELENVSTTDFSNVILELQTVDEHGDPLTTHRFQAGPLAGGKRGYFRHDVPRSGQEASGVLEVSDTVPSP